MLCFVVFYVIFQQFEVPPPPRYLISFLFFDLGRHDNRARVNDVYYYSSFQEGTIAHRQQVGVLLAEIDLVVLLYIFF